MIQRSLNEHDDTIKIMGFLQSNYDPYISHKITDDNNIQFIAMYVDELLIFSNN